MAVDLQSNFRNLRAASSQSTPTCFPHPPLRRNNSNDDTFRHTESGASISSEQPAPSKANFSATSPVAYSLRWLASGEEKVHPSTPPIDMPSPALDRPEADKESLFDTCFREHSLESFLFNRRTSISFNPRVTLDTGHQRPLEQPLPKLEISTKPRQRTILQDLSRSSIRLPLSRTQSEANRSDYNSVTGERKEITSPQIRSPENRSFPSFLKPTSTVFDNIQNHSGSEQSGSLTSNSTVSSGASEIKTPKEDSMETCVISPISAFPPFYQPASLEETTTWPTHRPFSPASRSKSYSLERTLSRRRNSRQCSTASRRSTSSSMSPATAFLSRFAREEALPEPDSEGQEVGEYVLGKEIGFGGFSTVKEAFTIEGDERVVRAVKVVRKQVAGKDDTANEQLQAEFEHEVGLWRCLAHRHILPLLAVHVTDFATFCFTKLNTGGTLFDLIRNNRQGISQSLARRYSYQLASAVRYLHEDMHVVHRDIKLENCLIDTSLPNAARDGGNLMLCDFGLAEFATNQTNRNSPDPYDDVTDRPTPKNIGPSETTTSIAGSLQYASPELIMSPAGFLSPVVDIWAFGVVVYALLVGDLPFQHSFQPRVQMMILAGEWNQEALKNANGVYGLEDEALDLIHGCLDMNSDERWIIGTVLKSGWLKGCQEMFEEMSESWKL
ncbi:MAG: hypothetical protein Q9190_004250 [Brigantiaea leucoxantha]